MIARPIAYVLAFLLLGSVLTNCNTSRRLDGVKLELAETREAYAEAARLAEAANRAKERAHTDEISAIKQKADHEKTALAADVARLARSLQNRPARPASGSVPAGTAGSVGCTGTSLHREDGEFLVGESARADAIRLQLARCQAAYDSAVKLTNQKD